MSNELLESLSRLKNDNDFKRLVEYLEELKLSRFRLAALQVEDVQSRWLQGRGQELDDLLDQISKCRDEIKHRKEHEREQKRGIDAF
jgi:hypothetical protein